MTSKLIRFVLPAVLLASACQKADDEDAGEVEELEPICDGSQAVRLGWKAIPGWEPQNTGINIQNGQAYLYVRGDCRYWVQPWERVPTIPLFETRTGVLDDATAEQLMELVQYGAWGSVKNSYLGGGSDEGIFYLFDTERTIACGGDCPTAPELVRTMFLDVGPLADQLWADGEPVDGPLRAGAYVSDEEAALVWDVEGITPAELIPPEGSNSVLIDDPMQIAALRAFRAAHPEIDSYDGLLVEHEGTVYMVGVRDTIPIETEGGWVPSPPQGDPDE